MIQDHGELFLKVILKVCYNKEELNYWEKRLIKSRDTLFPNGYNLRKGGESSGHLNNKAKEKLSIANTGKKQSNKTKSKRAISMRAESPYKNLLSEIDKHHFNYSLLAKILGFRGQTLSSKMLCKVRFTEKDIAKLVEIFGKPADYLMKRDDA